MEKLKDLLPIKENKKQINEAKLTARQMRSDLSNYINKNADKIAKEFIPKGTPYVLKKNSDGISFMIENSDSGNTTNKKDSDYKSFIQIDINLSQASGGAPNKYFDKATISEGTLSGYYNRSESSTKSAAKKVDDLLKTLVSDKKQLDKLTDLITDLADEYAQERIDDWDMGKLDESLEDMDVSLPAQVNKFLDRTINVVKSYNLPRKKEQLIIAKIVDALGVDKSQLGQAISKIKKYGIVQKEGKNVNGIDLDDYANDFQNYIAKKYRGKSISMWKLSVDPMSGAFYWSKSGSNVEVLATPFWDGEEKLPVDIQDTDSGDYISQKSFPLKFTGDMKKDEEAYFKILKLVLSKVK